MSTPEESTTPATSLAATDPDRTVTPISKQPRVLACLLCQQRKVKCDRRFPCANCTRAHAQCVPAATTVRQRRRRFPERELLDRLRHYETLLRQSNINFEALHRNDLAKQGQLPAASGEGGDRSTDVEQPVSPSNEDQASSPFAKVKSEAAYETKSLWDAMNQRAQSGNSDDDSDDPSADGIPEAAVKDAWNEAYQRKNNDHLLFGSREPHVDVSTLHPDQGQIFRLWQVYLENVNPLLKVTHAPTLQARIIEAASNVAAIQPSLAALMLSIYCVAILSLSEDECLSTFALSKEPLLLEYQLGCQQALMSCGVLRSTDRDSLTALYLYLISVKPAADPQSLSSMLAAAIRIAQRMGLHKDSTYVKYHALEAELRRRLWWGLVMFDNRLCEMSDYATTTLIPTWDCKIPLSLNDFDLQLEMKISPAPQERSSEAIFAVMRSELGNFIRHSAFHLDFVNPAMKALAKNIHDGPESTDSYFLTMESEIENNHVKFCNPENPLHFMTMWTAHGQLAKCRLMAHYSRFPRASVQQTDVQRNSAVSHALTMLECDTKLMNSSLTKGYRWFIDWYFPFPAYIHLVQDLRMRPVSDHAQRSWQVMTDNYEARFRFREHSDNSLYRAFSKVFLQAWAAREKAFSNSRTLLVPPRIVSDMQRRLRQNMQEVREAGTDHYIDDFRVSVDFPMSIPVGPGNENLLPSIGEQNFVGLETQSTPYQHIPGQTSGFDIDNTNWTPMDWNPWYPYDLGSL